MNRIDFSSEKTKDFIAGLVALFFVLTAGYFAMNKFNSPEMDLGTGGEEVLVDASTTTDVEGDYDFVYTQESGWVATDYVYGDIVAGTYTVAEGDTLWEVAEAVYGDGAMWTNILEANGDSIGYLANGEQALIVVGQTLVL